MKHSTMEELLRKAPRVAVPLGLEEQLNAGIRLSRAQQKPECVSPLSLWFKRLVPLSACVIVISAVAVQSVMLHSLTQENEKLNATLKSMEATHSRKQDGLDQLHHLIPELERLQKEQLEMHQLRRDVGTMRLEMSGLEKLRVDNLRLKEQQITANTATNMDFFTQQKIQADSVVCINNMKQIGLAARLWVNQQNDRSDPSKGHYPGTFAEFRSRVGNPGVFFCPIDAEIGSKATMADIDRGQSSYIFVTPGASIREPEVVLFRCPHHGHVTLVDGSVQMGGADRTDRTEEGRKVERR